MARGSLPQVEMAKASVERRMAGGFAHEVRNALSGAAMTLIDLVEPKHSELPFDESVVRQLKQIYERVGELEEPALSAAVLEQMRPISERCSSVQQRTELALKAIRRTLSLTNEIMMISKQGNEEIVDTVFNVAESIEDLVGSYREDMEKRRIRLEIDLEPGTLEARGGVHHFRAVLDNVFLNARDALYDSAVAGARIIVSAKSEDAVAIVRVEDNGPGIADGTLSQIFEPFFSAKESTGTGLELGIARRWSGLPSSGGPVFFFHFRFDGSTSIRKSVRRTMPLSRVEERCGQDRFIPERSIKQPVMSRRCRCVGPRTRERSDAELTVFAIQWRIDPVFCDGSGRVRRSGLHCAAAGTDGRDPREWRCP